MNNAEQWASAPKVLSLTANVVHVWKAALADSSPDLLSPDEREKASQFHFDRDRNRYVAGRNILRRLIARYENIGPEVIRFSYNTYGKPSLDGSSLRFNASHSADLALFAFTRQRQIGVDLERIRTDLATREIASQFFSEDEIATFRECTAESLPAAFFTCWTRKEAFIKAHGSGLSLPLHKFVVSVNGPARLIRTDFDPEAVHQWTLHDLRVPDGFAAALAVEGKPERIDCWQWE
jgi:4'-phosphopantetheinyl transferase